MRRKEQWLAKRVEELISELEADSSKVFDVVIVGSGYGGAVAASRFARARQKDGKPLSVCLLERGFEYVPGSFPARLSELPGHVRFSRGDEPEPKGRLEGLFDFRLGSDVSALVANGLGGGSLINAAVAERPPADVFDDPAWPAALRRDIEDLRRCFGEAEQMLDVNQNGVSDVNKYRALEELATEIGARARPAALAIHLKKDGLNPQGVEQHACIRCGDCVTGCNFRAKNTLAMNYLPDAVNFNAQLFTGVTVSHVGRRDRRKQEGTQDGKQDQTQDGKQEIDDTWHVSFRPTARQHPPFKEELSVRARHVVLAAGTYGSTEILLRSRERGLRVSPELGKHFSTNGDMISVLHDQRRGTVNAAPEETQPYDQRDVGPTITGIIEMGATRADRLVIEELAIPGALRRIFEEIVTTSSMLAHLGTCDLSVHRPDGPDPAAVDPSAIERSQIFAAMGNDNAHGQLALVEHWDRTGGDGAIKVDWKDAGTEPLYGRQDAALADSEKLGGRYLRNPLWQPIPTEISEALSGRKPKGKLLTVHPLGGCPMGDDSTRGVVDDIGRVFDARDKKSPARTHRGLLVLDGSILPVPVGINPLLTIAALAERAVERYASLQGWSLDRRAEPTGRVLQPAYKPPCPPEKPNTVVRISEKMSGDLSLPAGNTARVELEVEFAGIGNTTKPDSSKPGKTRTETIADFLRNGPHKVPIAKAVLAVEDKGKRQTAQLCGAVYWMERGATGPIGRTVHALRTWIRERALADFFSRVREMGFWKAVTKTADMGAIVALGSNVGEVRYLRYEMKLDQDLRQEDGKVLLARGTSIEGLKTFRYVPDGNPWRQLSELEVRIDDRYAGKLEIDLLDLFRRFAVQFQVERQLDQPTALIDIASIALFMARIVLKLHFWSFRAPEYEKYDADRARRRLPGELEGLDMEQCTLVVTAGHENEPHSSRRIRSRLDKTPGRGKEEPLLLPLTRYRRDKTVGGTPVLLIHGFGASGAQFAHPALRRNFVRHFAEKDRDVWVAELRTSIAVPSSYNQWTLDEVATEDIPAIVREIRSRTGQDQVDVVAHCIGSAMFCTAVLAGELEDLVRRAVLLQVGPLITLSDGNKMRGYAAAALRRYMLTDHVDSSVDDRADWLNVLIDRLVGTLPYPAGERGAHRLYPPCKPHTHIANCNRSAAVFGRLFQHANMDEAILNALGDLLGHTNLTTFEQTVQYAYMERLTDYDATNVYVTDANVRDYFNFPVLFLHGEKNDVFHPDTTQRSRDLLKRVFGPQHPVYRKVIDGYGHLDPIVGKDAEARVYARASKFLERSDFADSHAPEGHEVHYEPKRPLVGPLLGWLRRRREGDKWVARIWCRTDDIVSDAEFVVATVLDKGTPVRGHTFGARVTRKPAGDPNRSVDLLAIMDIDLPSGPGDYTIAIAGAHALKYFPDSSDPPPEKTISGLALEMKAAEKKAAEMKAAKPIRDVGTSDTRPLPDSCGEDLARCRLEWKERVEEGERARRTCDTGYDSVQDSVLIRQALRDSLEPDRDQIDLAVTSCRYAASRFDRERADAIFGHLRTLLECDTALPRPSLLLLAGDQIYADATAGMFDPKNRRARFYDAYREAWTAPNAREVLRQLPVYMMMDDHEVGDDWHPEDPPETYDPDDPDKKLRGWGLQAFREYQLSHSPLGNVTQGPYFYSFAAAGFPFFVCDTRSERVGRSGIMDGAQFDALKDWLSYEQDTLKNRPKFVLSPNVVVPFIKPPPKPKVRSRSDGWDGFPESLHDLFAFIISAGIENVVFLSGDPHLSMASRIEMTGALTALSIVASPMYAPFPFVNADAGDFVGKFEFPCKGGSMSYEVLEKSIVSGDSITLVSARQCDGGWEVTSTVTRGDDDNKTTVFELP